jgi:CBS domain containing-hemolysin-like protein
LRQPRSLIYQANFSNYVIFASAIFNFVQYSPNLISIKKPYIMGKWLAFSVKNLSKTLIPSALATSTDYWLRKIVGSLTELQVGKMQSKKISCRSSTKRM